MEEEAKYGKDLKEKAIKIKGKDYVLVADRVVYFNENYPNGMIYTEPSNKIMRQGDVEYQMVQVKAIVIPDCDSKRYFTAHSQAVWGDGYINKTSALENAETSAVGRALAMMGIGVIESIASADEINKAKNTEKISGTIIDKPGTDTFDQTKLDKCTSKAEAMAYYKMLTKEEQDKYLTKFSEKKYE